jgi:hypothetical protein
MARRRAVTAEQNEVTSVRAWVVTVVAGLSLLAVLVAGSFTRDAVRNWDRYTVAFSDINCEPPPGQDRLGFLAEVQYLAGMPNRLSVLDEDLGGHIAAAFARHPRVEKVEEVVVLPKRELHVRLRFRLPPDAASLPPDDSR